MNKETIFIMIIIVILNVVGFFIGFCYGKGAIVKIDDCVIYEETLYCEPENTLTIDFGG